MGNARAHTPCCMYNISPVSQSTMQGLHDITLWCAYDAPATHQLCHQLVAPTTKIRSKWIHWFPKDGANNNNIYIGYDKTKNGIYRLDLNKDQITNKCTGERERETAM